MTESTALSGQLTEDESLTFIEKLEIKSKQCLLNPLPSNFLRILPFHENVPIQGTTRKEVRFLEVGILKARLLKNYGITPMNLYCRVRFGDSRYETKTAFACSKQPLWNELFQCPMRTDTNLLSIVIMAEAIVMSDSKVAWATIPLPQGVHDGDTVNTWFELSGKQGEDVEGSIHLTLKTQTYIRTVPQYGPQRPQYMPVVSRLAGGGGATAGAGASSPAEGQPPPTQETPACGVRVSPEDVAAVKEIFPTIADDTIHSLLVENNGDRDVVTSHLIRMTTET